MNQRLPVVSARAPRVLGRDAPERPRVPVSRPLLCVGFAPTSAQAGLRFARALVSALAQGGRAPAVLRSRSEASASQAAGGELRAAGADTVIDLPQGELTAAAQAALDGLPPQAVAVGLGAELAQQLAALLTIRIGRSAPEAAFAADLELLGEAEAVASEIGAWLARR